MNLYNTLQNEKFIIAGPCVIESDEVVMTIADKMTNLSKKYGFTYIFKASFDKANRTSVESFRGPGLEKGLKTLGNIKEKF